MAPDLSRWRQSTTAARVALNVVRPRRSLFLLSHMRSYSSLLCHILNSNPDVDGYGELGISYRTPFDLLNQRHRISLATGEPLRGRYALDKLLHPGAQLSDSILTSPASTVMIGIREPAASVRSIIAMGAAKARPDWKAVPERAGQHYTRRLEHCLTVVGKRPDALVFPSDALLDDTASFLEGLTEWLGLAEPLTSDYETGAMTGRPRFGDTSDQIRSGTITVDRPRHDVEIPADLLDTIWDAYEQAMDELFDRAGTVLCPGSRAQRSMTAADLA